MRDLHKYRDGSKPTLEGDSTVMYNVTYRHQYPADLGYFLQVSQNAQSGTELAL